MSFTPFSDLFAKDAVNLLVHLVHDEWAVPAGWWTDLATGQPKDRNIGELLCLVHSEIDEAAEETPELAEVVDLLAEAGALVAASNVTKVKLLDIHRSLSRAMEGARKNKMDDHLPHRSALEVELADAMIRIVDIAGGRGLDLGGAFVEKMAYNRQRADHKIENRRLDGGKAF